MKKQIIVISGPTASGKSKLALQIAKDINGSIINADSMQIYKEIPIITAQPKKEDFLITDHLLYGAISVNEICSASRYIKMVDSIIRDIIMNNKIPIIVGGSGLYIKSLLYGLSEIPDIDPQIREGARALYQKIGSYEFYKVLESVDKESAKVLNPNDKQRLIRAYEVFMQTGYSIEKFKSNPKTKTYLSEFDFLNIGLFPERTILYESINKRFLLMLEENVLDEIKYVNSITKNDDLPARKAHGLRELTAYLDKKISLEEAISRSQQITRNYAKRQLTWLKHQAQNLIAIEYEDIEHAITKCKSLIH